jgi:hypothetical protein
MREGHSFAVTLQNIAILNQREFDEPLPDSLPLGNGKGGATLFAPLSVSERGWGRGQIRLVELTLNHL